MDYEKQLRTRVDQETFDRYSRYADKHFDGNISEGLRQLLARGYGQLTMEDVLDKYFAERLEPKIVEIEERLAKTTSRGTKASLGNLALMAESMMAVCSILRSIDRDNHVIMKHLNLRYDDESEGAFDRIYELMTAHPAKVFNWAWDAGGRMQGQKGSPNFITATRGLELHYPEEMD